MIGTTVFTRTNHSITDDRLINTITCQRSAKTMIRIREQVVLMIASSPTQLLRDSITHTNLKQIPANSLAIRRRAVKRVNFAHSFTSISSRGIFLLAINYFYLKDFR